MEINQDQIQINKTPAFFRISMIVGLVSLIASVALGFCCGGEHKEQFYFSALTSAIMVVGFSLGAMIFLLIHYVSGAQWSVVVRRITEIILSVIPYTGALLVILILSGSYSLYSWSHADVMAADAGLQRKAAYLNINFFTIRMFAYVIIWMLLARFYYRNSIKADQTDDEKVLNKMKSMAPISIILFALTVTFSAFDWIMSLDPHWYSTIFGAYIFSGYLMAFLALCIIICRILQAAGYLKGIITVEHYHDLGKLMFAFTCFWAFMAFSQYMLIWYGNIPEETIFFSHRWAGHWKCISLLLPIGHFAIPFVLLMSRLCKRNLKFLTFIAVWLILMEFVDLHWLILPNLHHEGFHLTLLDVTTHLGFVGIFLGVLGKKLTRVPLIPTNDPFLEKSLHHISR